MCVCMPACVSACVHACVLCVCMYVCVWQQFLTHDASVCELRVINDAMVENGQASP